MTHEPYWTYQPGTPTPTLEQAIAAGAISPETTEADWHKLSPGMRREIVRSLGKQPLTQPTAD